MLSIIWCAGLIALSALGTAQAQTNPIQGTPGSPFPYARSNEIQMIISRFNREGLAAVHPHHAGAPRICFAAQEQQRILAEYARSPEREQDGTVTWSLSLLHTALRQAPDGLPQVIRFTIARTLHEGGSELAEGPHRVRDRRCVGASPSSCFLEEVDRSGYDVIHTTD
jgi:hypothetical protein